MVDPNIVGSPILLIVLYIWSLIAKGIALWRAANLKQRNWFIAILVLNTLGVLDLVYLFKFAEKKLTFKEIRSWVGK
ncbi:MAG: hypothetical protein A3C30_00705 [Candidatus Levybacteria bacterium RIFCSPHIGHO2_02_FULL_40_18]|nr:MAG: hypothetical protein A2869_03225 [Candidatus Levybacteria bacterium RIFCSPHIGHO2_01_FULL_40_58]OGH27221.1 MAG: hypothetical protein A3C30_00705 [Candidatus Levybacteria bacterium RIFCSPHIGHO2_02_FULL_40_18]OGH31080.1 MAG: hypothetical protein A3E43_05120 [Candidatus Levybacteria bacterium RIFCSPHIGHO2_12_FULL_40_31]OGH40752.1 MAG: hypothetical protein A2894_03320 [Candidatus Levybacteria bacterium RIFCSPLOWO2_01_FULL_40_64]OGH49390.1 MAG: hypothetical protein A3I54_01960 [Candidatus Lev